MSQILDFIQSVQDVSWHNPSYSLVHQICSIGWTRNNTDISKCEATLGNEV